jgi:mycoredoxin
MGKAMAKRIVMYTTPWCGDCRAAKKFLAARGIPYEEVDIDQNPDAARVVIRLNDGMRMVPTLDVEGTIVSGDRFDAARFERDLRAAGAL